MDTQIPKSLKDAFTVLLKNHEISNLKMEEAIQQHSIIRNHNDGEKIHQFFIFGSYKRNTKIAPLNDIDMILWLKKEKDINKIKQEKANRFLDQIVTWLHEQKKYNKLKLKQREHCVQIEFLDSSSEIAPTIDIVPAFGKKSDPDEQDSPEQAFLIPTKDTGKWVYTNPRKYEAILKQKNENSDYRIIPLIKIFKIFNKECKGELLQSYHIECLTLSAFTKKPDAFRPSGLIRPLFETTSYICDTLSNKNSIPDPAGYSRNVANYLYDNQDVVNQTRYNTALKNFQKLKIALEMSIELESSGDLYSAIVKLRPFFGKHFPDAIKGDKTSGKKPKDNQSTRVSPDAPNQRFG